MKKYKVELLPTAWNDLQEIFDYISIYSPESATKVLDKIMGSLRRLETFPNSGSYVPDDKLRKHNFRMVIASPYISFYRLINNDMVYIYHIVHGAKNYKDLLKPYIKL
jgi:toxin ParE1/3/4